MAVNSSASPDDGGVLRQFGKQIGNAKTKAVDFLTDKANKYPLIASIALIAISALLILAMHFGPPGFLLAMGMSKSTFTVSIMMPAIMTGAGGIAIGLTALAGKKPEWANAMERVRNVVVTLLFFSTVGFLGVVAFKANWIIFTVVILVGACSSTAVLKKCISSFQRRSKSKQSRIQRANGDAQIKQLKNASDGADGVSPKKKTTSRSSSTNLNPQERLVAFYNGTSTIPTSGQNLTFKQVCELSFEELENRHDYIQWLFPTKNRSKHNPKAPVLDDSSIDRLKQNRKFHEGLTISFKSMLRFYGLEYTDGEVVRSSSNNPKELFKTRANVWIRKDNHNYKRLTRMITSLRIFGHDQEAKALYERLKQVAETKTGKKIIDQATLKHWKDAATKPV